MIEYPKKYGIKGGRVIPIWCVFYRTNYHLVPLCCGPALSSESCCLREKQRKFAPQPGTHNAAAHRNHYPGTSTLPLEPLDNFHH